MRASSRFKGSGSFVAWGASEKTAEREVPVQAVAVIGSRYTRAFSRFKGSGSFVDLGASEKTAEKDCLMKTADKRKLRGGG